MTQFSTSILSPVFVIGLLSFLLALLKVVLLALEVETRGYTTVALFSGVASVLKNESFAEWSIVCL